MVVPKAYYSIMYMIDDIILIYQNDEKLNKEQSFIFLVFQGLLRGGRTFPAIYTKSAYAMQGKEKVMKQEQNTHLSNEIDSAGYKAQYDEHVKRILADKNVLAYILVYSVKEFRGYTLKEAREALDGEPKISQVKVRPEAVEQLENKSKLPSEGKMYFDIVFTVTTKDNERQKIYINVEAQKSFFPGYDLVTRGIIYSARLISKQMDVEYTSKNYDGVKKVYSIWICMNAPGKNKEQEKVADSITEYSLKPTELYPASDTVVATGRYDLMSTIFVNLKPENTLKSENDLIGMLSVLLSEKMEIETKKRTLESDYGLPMSQQLEMEVAAMCNLSDIVEDRGKEQGIEIGKEQGRLETIYDLVQSGFLTLEQGAEKLDISVEKLRSDMEAANFHVN